jgi:hypothetical protein
MSGPDYWIACEKIRVSPMSAPLTRQVHRCALAVALAITLGGCGDVDESSKPSTAETGTPTSTPPAATPKATSTATAGPTDTGLTKRDAEATALDYYEAVGDADGDKACSLMTDRAQAQMDAEFEQGARSTPTTHAVSKRSPTHLSTGTRSNKARPTSATSATGRRR